MNFPMMPGQNKSGKKGAKVVTVPERTGTNISPAAILAARSTGIRPLPKIRCVFSITTIASSTMIPRPNSNAKRTMKLSVTCVPTITSAIGRNINATNTLKGTLNATKKALLTPIKNIRTNSTRTKPIIIVLMRSLKDVRV